MQYEHGLRIDQIHGAGTAARLRLLGNMHEKHPEELLKKMIKDYRVKVKVLRKKKGL
jgi:hypothetical protein